MSKGMANLYAKITFPQILSVNTPYIVLNLGKQWNYLKNKQNLTIYRPKLPNYLQFLHFMLSGWSKYTGFRYPKGLEMGGLYLNIEVVSIKR